MLTTGVHSNRPPSRGTPRTTSKLYLPRGERSHARQILADRVTARDTKTGGEKFACGKPVTSRCMLLLARGNFFGPQLVARRGYLLGSEAFGLLLLGRREEGLDLVRRWRDQLGTRRCRRRRLAVVLLARQIRLQIADLAVRPARWRRLSPEFPKTTRGTTSGARRKA